MCLTGLLAACFAPLSASPGLASTYETETIHRCLLTIYKSKHDNEGVRNEYRSLIHLDPQRAYTHFEFSKWLDEMQMWQEALDEVRLAVELDPENCYYRACLVNVLKKLNRNDEADEMLERMMKEDELQLLQPEAGLKT